MSVQSASRRLRILVTGVDQPQGAYAAKVLAALGHSVIAHRFSHEAADAVAADTIDTGGSVTPVVADLTLEPEISSLFRSLENPQRCLDVLGVYAAWLPGPETSNNSIEQVKFCDWQRFMQQHAALMFLPMRAAYDTSMRQNKSMAIIAVSGLGSTNPDQCRIEPAPARAAVDGGAEAFVQALRRSGQLPLTTIRLIARPRVRTDDPNMIPSFDEQLSTLVSENSRGTVVGAYQASLPTSPLHAEASLHA